MEVPLAIGSAVGPVLAGIAKAEPMLKATGIQGGIQALARKVMAWLWVKGRRRWLVVGALILVMLGVTTWALKTREGGCDCGEIHRRLEAIDQQLLEQRKLLAVHQRWIEDLMRPRRTSRALVPSLQVMLDLLDQGHSQAQILEYLRTGQVPTSANEVYEPSDLNFCAADKNDLEIETSTEPQFDRDPLSSTNDTCSSMNSAIGTLSPHAQIWLHSLTAGVIFLACVLMAVLSIQLYCRMNWRRDNRGESPEAMPLRPRDTISERREGAQGQPLTEDLQEVAVGSWNSVALSTPSDAQSIRVVPCGGHSH